MTCDYVICLRATLPESIFALSNFETQSGLDTKHLVRGDPRQMQQLSHAFAEPLTKSRGAPGRRGAQFGNRWYIEYSENFQGELCFSG